MPKKHVIITIGRTYGSGGREIGERLAKRLNLKCYDKQIIYKAADESGLDPQLFKQQNEEVKSPIKYFLSHLATTSYTIGYEDLPMSDQLFMAQSRTILDIADSESCVIVGRLGSYVLEQRAQEHLIINCFIHNSSLEQRIHRVMERNELSYEDAEERVHKVSKGRKNYYERYTGNKWGQSELYDISLNTAPLTIDAAVDILEHMVKAIIDRHNAFCTDTPSNAKRAQISS